MPRMTISMPRYTYFVPFLNIIKIVYRFRKSEEMIKNLSNQISLQAAQIAQLKAEISHMKENSYREVQYYESRVENIYQNIMKRIDLSPEGIKMK